MIMNRKGCKVMLNENVKLKSSTIKKIDDLTKKVENEERVESEVVISLLKEIFDPNEVYKDVQIPLSFLTSELGTIFVSALAKTELNDYLSVAEICKITGLTRQYIGAEIKRGNLPAKMQGKVWMVRKREFEEYMKKKK